MFKRSFFNYHQIWHASSLQGFQNSLTPLIEQNAEMFSLWYWLLLKPWRKVSPNTHQKITEKNAFKLYCIDHVLVAALSISMKENRAVVFQDEFNTLPEGLFCRGDLGRFPSFSARINMYISTLLTRKSTHVSHPMLSYFLRNRHKQTIYYSYRLQPSDLYISYINYIKGK